ncbi:MAG: hypothetical protein ACT4O2_08910 [Beijerinckiaceae bacterium]
MNTITKAASGLVSLVTCTSIAYAATQPVATSKIESNAAKHQLVLSHHTYKYNPKIAKKRVKQGKHVKVFYRQREGHRTAYKIVPMPG